MRNDTPFASDSDMKQAGIGDAAKKVTEGLGELRRAVTEGRQNIVEPVSQFIQEKPLAAIGVAFGLGYLLGGGLFTKTTGRLLGLGWRLGGMAIAKNILGNLADNPAPRF